MVEVGIVRWPERRGEARLNGGGTGIFARALMPPFDRAPEMTGLEPGARGDRGATPGGDTVAGTGTSISLTLTGANCQRWE